MAETVTTPLYDLHRELGAKIVPFAGYSLPVQYSDGVLREHLHTRSAAGLFDVSHMGQVRLSGAQAGAVLERLIPVDLLGLATGRQRYGFFTHDNGGILDDLMITRGEDDYLLVLNAACKQSDIAHLRSHLQGDCQLEELSDRALIALQGPAAAGVMTALAPMAAELVFMSAGEFSVAGIPCFVSRSGYTGEDGFEISVHADEARALAEALLAHESVRPVGLGARDSLRLEAGLCLYGHDIDTTTTPVEAGLNWAMQKVRRPGGEREGGFPGWQRVYEQLENGPSRRRVGLAVQGRAPVREGVELIDHSGAVVGKVTSGGFGPSVKAPVAMAYVESRYAEPQTALFARVRDKSLAVVVTQLPFIKPRYYRGS